MTAGRLALVALTVGIACAVAPPVRAQSATDVVAGRPLGGALRLFQARGLRLVYSSELVTPDMRVVTPPRAGSPREQLAALLEPHGLAVVDGPGGVLQVVRRARSAVPMPRAVTTAPAQKSSAEPPRASEALPAYRERVTVKADPTVGPDARGRTSRRLDARELRMFASTTADDPLRSLQATPGVAGGDDFRSELSVRGSAYRHAGVVVDGVAAAWLRHASPGRGDTATLTMLRGDVVQDATLRVGAYPRLDGGQLGPQLDVTLREGSRAEIDVQGVASSTNATVMAEGPLGGSAKGSWLVGGRKSYANWPLGHDAARQTVFGFGDVQSKVVYDVRPTQQFSASLVAGLTNVERDAADPLRVADGLNRAGLFTVAWRSSLGARTVVTQRASSIAETFHNTDESLRTVNRGSNGALAYRVDLRRALSRGFIESGVQVRRVRGIRRGVLWPARSAGAAGRAVDANTSWLERSAYVSVRRDVRADVQVTLGARLADSGLVDRGTVDRWVQAEWTPAAGWLVHGSAGLAHQFPELDNVDGWTNDASLRPERALNADIGIGHGLSERVRWDVTVFARRERDGLREPAEQPWLFAAGRARPWDTRFENALTGVAHGVEVTVERRSAAGFTGWVGYAFGVSTTSDPRWGERFAVDFDQRHTLNAAGSLALPWRARIGATFRGGTNVPVVGYFTSRGGRLFLGETRNAVRGAGYARLDLRAEKTTDAGGRAVTVFGEVVNALDRVNMGRSHGAIVPETQEAVGFAERLFPRLFTAGVRFAF